MLSKLFVGNLSWSIGDIELEEIFSPHTTVRSARVITDRDSGRSRGFGFVEIETDNLAEVIQNTDGQEVGGRNVRVSEAQDRKPGGNRRGGPGGGGPGGGRGGRDNRRNRY
jgi:RNA recognition motif-containing protein